MANKVALAFFFACVTRVEASEDSCHEDFQGEVSLLQARSFIGKARAKNAAGQGLSDTIAKYASSLEDGSTKQLLHSFKICTECQDEVRWGEEHDGGYVMCRDGLGDGKIQAAYSIGVEGHDQWSEDVYNALKVPVNQFDCTVDKPAKKCPDCHFFQVCLSDPAGQGGVPDHTNWDLEAALAKSGQESAADRSLLMKIDIEGAEWWIFSSPTGAPLKKFQEIIVEFHQLGNEEKHPLYLKAVQAMLAAGFSVSHVHGNNYEGTYNKDGYSLPNVLEATFVAGGQTLSHCVDPQNGPLDQPNAKDRDELPDSSLP